MIYNILHIHPKTVRTKAKDIRVILVKNPKFLEIEIYEYLNSV